MRPVAKPAANCAKVREKWPSPHDGPRFAAGEPARSAKKLSDAECPDLSGGSPVEAGSSACDGRSRCSISQRASMAEAFSLEPLVEKRADFLPEIGGVA